MEIKVGDKFEREYPFKLYSYDTITIQGSESIEEWVMGCNRHTEEYGEGYGETFFNAGGLGKIIFEVLAVVEMPRKYQDRVIYKFDRVDPDDDRKNGSKCYMVTMSRFLNMLERPFTPEYEIN